MEEGMLSTLPRVFVWMATSAVLAGCAAAAAGAAGAATGIYITSRGASGIVEGSVDDVARRTEQVFAEMGITVTGREIETENGRREIEIKGETADLDVKADIESETATSSRIHVEARKSAVEWDQDFAKAVVERIVAR
jgi:hypothetical protein